MSILANKTVPKNIPRRGSQLARTDSQVEQQTNAASLQNRVAGCKSLGGNGLWDVLTPKLCLGIARETASWYRPKACQGPLS